ncbi:MAG TPA: hypothetical protein VE964_06490 [Myxococcales bacterium]|nr:hypothetical protein [Myxococcales bacterium]
MDALRAAGGLLLLVSLVQLCAAAGVGLLVMLLREPPRASSREGA